MKAASGLRDAIRVEQASVGTFEVPNREPKSQKKDTRCARQHAADSEQGIKVRNG